MTGRGATRSPGDIDDRTSAAGLVGWIGEDLARAAALRLAALVALVGALGAATSGRATALPGIAAITVGLGGVLALAVSQTRAWPRHRQWGLILGLLAVTGPLLVFHLAHG